MPPRRELLVFEGGLSTGDPCQARAHHGFNGIERDVVPHRRMDQRAVTADWMPPL